MRHLLLNHCGSSIALRSLARDSPALFGIASAAWPPFWGGRSARCDVSRAGAVGAESACPCALSVGGGYGGANGGLPAPVPIGRSLWRSYMVDSMEGTSELVGRDWEATFWIILLILHRELVARLVHMSKSCGVRPGGGAELKSVGYRGAETFGGVGPGGAGGGDGGKTCSSLGKPGSFPQNLELLGGSI